MIIAPSPASDSNGYNVPERRSVTTTINGKPTSINYVHYKGVGPEPRKIVVFLCGGPSQCSKAFVNGIPEAYDMITLDPVGLGNNFGPALSPQMKSLDAQASAVKSLVEQLGLKDYVIDGRSIGTAIATATAAKIGADAKMNQPKGVILEGTLGPKNLPSRDYVHDSERAWALLSGSDRDLFKRKFRAFGKAFPKYSDRSLDMMIAFLKRGPAYTATSIKELNQEDLREWPAIIDRNLQTNKAALDTKSDQGESLYRALGCQVIGHRQNPANGLILFDKESDMFKIPTLNEEPKICRCRSVDEDYDPCKFQIKVPIIYLHGEYDPVAAMKGARAHEACQKTAPDKRFIVLKDAGHFVSDVRGRFSSCLGNIYGAAFRSDLSTLAERQDWDTGCDKAMASPANPETSK